MRKSSLLAGLGFAFMGTMVLLNVLGNPRIEAAHLHGTDIIRFVASGGLFGVALMMLTASKWARKE